MAKVKFVCNNCGYETGKWFGRCPECNTWNSLEETTVFDKKSSQTHFIEDSPKVHSLDSITPIHATRVPTSFEEFNRVLGGDSKNTGMVKGAAMLLSGDPGVGKSTLLLQIALSLAKEGKKTLYITGEESETQVKMRADRIANTSAYAKNLLILSTTNIDAAVEVIEKEKPSLIIVDSIQTMASLKFPGFPGSIPQIRYATSLLVTTAKRNHIPLFMVGHVTKEGVVAGPQLLSHMVDVVLYLEGELLTGTRILRAYKNRFGDTSEVGIFFMQEKGMVQISDASNFFVDPKDKRVPGASLAVIMEGSRPILVEVQALVVPSSLSFPRRVANGIPEKRLGLLLAVIQKHAKVPVERMDIFVNIVGGLTIREVAVDLAVCLAVLSSYKNKPLSSAVAIAEVGLLGELKTVVNLDKRIKEAKKLGFKRVISAKDFQFLKDVSML